MIRPRHVFLSSLLVTSLVALAIAVPTPLQAASSYFMIQGPLGAGGSYETYKFRVEYSSVLNIPGFATEDNNSGFAMLAAIFGNGVNEPTGIYSNSVGTVAAPGAFLQSFQMAGGSPVASGIYPTGPQWGYFASGGTYVNTWADPVINGTYDPGIWTESKTGMTTRYLADGSFDAWSFGVMTDTGEDDEFGFDIYAFAPPVDVTPTLGDFTGALYAETKISADGLPYTVYRITSVPEPGRMLLMLVALGGMVLVRRSRRAYV